MEGLDLDWVQSLATVIVGLIALLAIMIVAGAALGLLGLVTAAVGGADGL